MLSWVTAHPSCTDTLSNGYIGDTYYAGRILTVRVATGGYAGPWIEYRKYEAHRLSLLWQRRCRCETNYPHSSAGLVQQIDHDIPTFFHPRSYFILPSKLKLLHPRWQKRPVYQEYIFLAIAYFGNFYLENVDTEKHFYFIISQVLQA